MTIDELLKSALRDKGSSLDASNLFAVVADIATGELFILGLEVFLHENFRFFLQNEEVSVVLLAVYFTEQTALDCLECIRESNKLSANGLIADPNFHVLIADIKENRLYSLPLMEYYIGYMVLYQYKAKAAEITLVLNIFSNKEAVEETIEFIRMYIKDEGGNIV